MGIQNFLTIDQNNGKIPHDVFLEMIFFCLKKWPSFTEGGGDRTGWSENPTEVEAAKQATKNLTEISRH